MTVSNDGQTQDLGKNFTVYYIVNGVSNSTNASLTSSLSPGSIGTLTAPNMTNYGSLSYIRVYSPVYGAIAEKTGITGVVC